jgi:hypothetical protein
MALQPLVERSKLQAYADQPLCWNVEFETKWTKFTMRPTMLIRLRGLSIVDVACALNQLAPALDESCLNHDECR